MYSGSLSDVIFSHNLQKLIYFLTFQEEKVETLLVCIQCTNTVELQDSQNEVASWLK